MNFSLSFDNVKEIPLDKYEKNFTFIVDDKKYETSRYVADLVSPIIRQYHYTDETINSFVIHTCNNETAKVHSTSNEEDYFADFLRLPEFNTKTINETQMKRYTEYFIQLGNINEYLKLQPEMTSELNSQNVIDRLNHLIKIVDQHKKTIKTGFEGILNDSNVKKLIEFASSHFNEVCNDKLKRLPIEIISEILDEKTLEIEDEDCLLNFILDLYCEDDRYSILFEYVKFQNLSNESLTKFYEKFNIEDINCGIWKSIFKLLLQPNEMDDTQNKRYSLKIKTFEHDSNNEFHGIMRHLSEETNENIHDNGTIEITTNSLYNDSDSYHPKNVVDYQKNNNYESNNKLQDAEICFDFKDNSIQLSEYSIQTSSGDQNGYHLRNWVVEVSNDKKKWDIVDQHNNDSSLRGKSLIVTFKTKEMASFYRYIRIRQTGKSWNDSYETVIYYLEFYGKLKEAIKKKTK